VREHEEHPAHEAKGGAGKVQEHKSTSLKRVMFPDKSGSEKSRRAIILYDKIIVL